jgi:hypothetical protein
VCTRVRRALAPPFVEFSVDLVVQGHNDQYERTDPLWRRPVRGAGSGRDDGAPGHRWHHLHPRRLGRAARYKWQPGETDRYRGFADPDNGTSVASFVSLVRASAGPSWWTGRRRGTWTMPRCRWTWCPGAPGADSTPIVRAITDTGREIDRVILVRPAGARIGA